PIRPPPSSPLFPYTTLFRSNMNGGGGVPAMNKVQTAKPDGNTILFAHSGHLIVNEVSQLIDYKFDDKLDIACIAAVDKSVVMVADRKSTRLNSSHVKISYAV